MSPCSYTEKDGVYEYHYSFSDIRAFIKETRDRNTYGFFLTRFDGKYFKMRGLRVNDDWNITVDNAYVPEFWGEFDPVKFMYPDPPKELEWGILIPQGRIK